MIIKALILSRQDGVGHRPGDVFYPHHRPALLPELSDQLAVGTKDT
jgi:hypothetical protein